MGGKKALGIAESNIQFIVYFPHIRFPYLLSVLQTYVQLQLPSVRLRLSQDNITDYLTKGRCYNTYFI